MEEDITKQIVEKLELINDLEILNYINIIVSDIILCQPNNTI